ncbi:hypothetical protein GCM10007962_30600 [Yeosuana aromativorans]|uniref:Uncharacterized protein n=1 Tax=Yeosuana aromativorans TaxID=288019 RepID=A0A8J3BRY1_9FLAO|nr:hypothetical protein [Yeosuana aromativorans]GGK34055.1 hypothetical protein GCM10007962_30600 [Yeosuana aromativorans]
MSKKIIFLMISVMVLVFTSCDDEYNVSPPLDNNEAKVVNVFIDPGHFTPENRNIAWKLQRDYYDHDAKTVTIKVIANTVADLSKTIVWISGSFQATFTPLGGEEEDWTVPRQYTFTSGDGTVTNTYTITIVEVASF